MSRSAKSKIRSLTKKYEDRTKEKDKDMPKHKWRMSGACKKQNGYFAKLANRTRGLIKR
jgi:hypothetical protein